MSHKSTALIIGGFGLTGRSLRRYLEKSEHTRNWDVYDSSPIDIHGSFFAGEMECFSEPPSREELVSYKKIYITPGINPKTIYPNGELDDISLLTDIDIFLQEDESFKIGITGTNGKSTCCYHLSHILKDSQLIGNMGIPVLDHINSGKKYSIIELSSFQLEHIKEVKLDFGVLLNIAPDHIDRHGSFEEYSRVKQRILEAKFSTTESDPYKLYFMITGETQEQESLGNLPHRCESIIISDRRFINDAKSTNLASLEFAMKDLNEPYCLLLCGDPNKEQYRTFKINGPEEVFIFGKHAAEIDEKISHAKKTFLNGFTLDSVLKIIAQERDKKLILFSPGHPSGKDYQNFEERGNDFKKLVEEIFNDR